MMNVRFGSSRDSGLSLLESLLAIAIMTTSFAALVGGMRTYVFSSGIHREQASAARIVRAFAESVKAETYVDCAAATDYGTDFAAPPGFQTSVTAVAYWDGGSWASACPATDHRLERVTLSVRSSGGTEESVDVVLRDPVK